MPAEIRSEGHHAVVGAVHVLTLMSTDPRVTREEVMREWRSCSPRRIVVDLTGVNGALEPHLEAIRETTLEPSLMVKLQPDQRPTFVGPSSQATTRTSA